MVKEFDYKIWVKSLTLEDSIKVYYNLENCSIYRGKVITCKMCDKLVVGDGLCDILTKGLPENKVHL